MLLHFQPITVFQKRKKRLPGGVAAGCGLVLVIRREVGVGKGRRSDLRAVPTVRITEYRKVYDSKRTALGPVSNGKTDETAVDRLEILIDGIPGDSVTRPVKHSKESLAVLGSLQLILVNRK